MMLLAPLAFLPAILSSPAETDWTTYTNPRFHYAVDLPPYLKPGPEPVDSDGRAFAGEGVTVLVYGSNRINSPAQEFRAAIATWQQEGRVTYQVQTKDSFTLSGIASGALFYQRSLTGKSGHDPLMVTVSIRYPADQAKAFAPTLARITKSLRLK
jgi:hypothetical protein